MSTSIDYPIIDEVTGTSGRHRYTLARVYRIGEDTVQIVLARDLHQDASFAVASVLTPDRRWSTLTENPTSNWFDDTPAPAAVKVGDITRILGPHADHLAQRAATILD